MTVAGAKKNVSGEILSGVYGADDAKCTVCGVTISVRHGGANDVAANTSLAKSIAKQCPPCRQPLA